jgi:hypothetical protein
MEETNGILSPEAQSVVTAWWRKEKSVTKEKKMVCPPIAADPTAESQDVVMESLTQESSVMMVP